LPPHFCSKKKKLTLKQQEFMQQSEQYFPLEILMWPIEWREQVLRNFYSKYTLYYYISI